MTAARWHYATGVVAPCDRCGTSDVLVVTERDYMGEATEMACRSCVEGCDDDSPQSVTYQEALLDFYDLGPRCTTCHHHEAHCANHGRCCETCSHFRQDHHHTPADCGTHAGFLQHRRRHERSCIPCRLAHHYLEQESA